MTKGDRAVKFIEALRIPKGKRGNQLFKLEPWQRDYIRTLFGTLDPEGRRQYTDSLLFIPKKNGKSTLCACIVIYCLFCEPELGGEIYSAANTREQASIVFNLVAAMLRADPYLSKLCKIRDSQKRIVNPATNTVYKALSADAGDKNGLNASVIIYDEIAEAPSSDLFDALTTGMASRAEPLTISITTAGFDTHGIGYRLYEHAKRVKDDPSFDRHFLPVIYEADPEADWKDLAVWQSVNPNWGVSVEANYAEKKIAKVAAMPSSLNTILRYHLNIWTQADIAWLPKDRWESCGAEPVAIPDGSTVWASFDLSATTDLTALCLLARQGDNWVATYRFYLPKATAERKQNIDRVPYLHWAREGWITLTDGDVIDYDFIRHDILALGKRYKIKEIAYDRWGATEITTKLQGDGFNLVPFGQGFGSMAAPSKEFETLVVGQKFKYNNPVLKWMGGNAVAEIDAAGNIKPTKVKSTEKIDGIVATVMALGRAILDTASKPSVYEGRGLLTI